MNDIILFFSFVLAFLLTLYGTPIAQKAALRYNLLDVPDGRLKKHGQPTPYMGGVIVYFAFIAPASLVVSFDKPLLGILFSSAILMTVGLFDDLKALTPGIKFLFQLVATYILLKSDVYINLTFLPDWLNAALSFIWILTCINAVNIIDIMDGLASTIGALSCLTLFVISLYGENFLICLLSLSMAAALLGFLRFNWQPARIYLGDAGSMFIGMCIGTLTIMSGYTRFNRLAFLSAFLIMGVPLIDLVYVMILRVLKGKSPFFGSPDHLALRIRKRFGFNAAQTVCTLGFFQLTLCAAAIVNFYTTPTVTLITCGALLAFTVGAGIFLARVRME